MRKWLFRIGAAAPATVALVAYVVLLLGYRWGWPPTDVEAAAIWGQWGDFVGGILNPLLGVLTFSGLLMTIVLQREELEISRNELKLSRNEMSLSRGVAEGQLRHIKDEARRNDISRMIFRLAGDIDTILHDEPYSDSSAVKDYINAKYDNIVMAAKSGNLSPKTSKYHSRIFELVEPVKALDKLLDKFREAGGDDAVLSYYRARYFALVNALVMFNLVKQDEVAQILLCSERNS